MTKKAVLYARVSTDEQADKGYSLPSQLEMCRKYADRLGYEVVTELREDYSGATSIAQRPEGKKLAALLKARNADAVIVYQVDRLSRDIVDLLASVQQWIRAGVEVHTCDIGKIESELEIVLVIKGWQGGDERKKIIERTTRGRNHKAQAGKVVGSGKALYGYRYSDGELNIIEDEARIVRLICEWYVKGETDERGEWRKVSTHEICRRLQAMGAPVPSKNHFWGERRGIWSPDILYKILKNETYAGVWRYGKNIGNGGRMGKRPIEEQIAVNVPAIIDRDLWNAAQAKREYNVLMSKRRAKFDYLLRGLVRCNCGLRMIGRHRADVNLPDPRYYRCQTETRTWVTRECKQKIIRADGLETGVWGYVKGLLENAVEYESLLREAQRGELEQVSPKQQELETVEQLLCACEAEVTECAAALRIARGKVRGKLEGQQDEINARYDALSKRHAELSAKITTRQLTDEAVDSAMQFREHVIAGMQNPSPETKRRILEILGVEVKVNAARFWVCFRVGTNRPAFDLQTS